MPTLGTLLLPEVAIAQTVIGPIRWQDPSIVWQPGASSQPFNQFSCPGNTNTVTITFGGAYDRFIGGAPYPAELVTPIGTGGGPARELLFTGMGNTAGGGNPPNPGFEQRNRQTEIDVTFANPVILGNLFVADVDLATTGNANTRWVDQVIVTANGGTVIPNTTPGVTMTPVAPTVVNVTGNVATGIGDSPNSGTGTERGNVNVDFGSTLLNSIRIIYRNDTATATGIDGSIQAQGIAIGDFNFANPCITVAKEAGTLTQVSPGVYQIPYTIRVRNTGNVPVENVQLTENLAASLGLTLGGAPLAPGQYRVVAPPAGTITAVGTPPTSPLTAPASVLNGNSSFNGSNDTNLLGAGSVLRAGAEGNVAFTLEIRPQNASQPLNNQVTATGDFTPPGGTTPIRVTSSSVNGSTPLTNPNTTGSPTPVLIPQIGTAKTISSAQPVTGQPGVFDVTYVINVQNTGSENLQNVQVVENFAAPLQPGNAPDPIWASLSHTPNPNPAVGQYTIIAAATVSGSLTAPNTSPTPGNFTGSGVAPNTNLLAATGNTLNVGQSGTITFTARLHPNPSLLPTAANNQVQALGTGVSSGLGVNDTSVNGTNPDANGNGTPTDDESPTPVTLPPGPRIGVAKALGTVTDAGSGRYNLQYTIRVQNYGSTALNNVQVTEDFAAQFGLTQVAANPGPGQFSVISAPAGSGTLAGNNAFTGSGANTGLLNPGGSTLAIGQSETITLTIQVNPATLPTTLNNQVTASGTDPANPNTPVTDQSANGAPGDPNPNPDPNGNNVPDEQSPTPVTLPPSTPPSSPARIGVAKAVGLPRDLGNGIFEVPYTIRVQNYGGVNLTNVRVEENFSGAIPPANVPDPGWSSLSYTPNPNPSPGQYTVTRAPEATGTLTGNAAFTGNTTGSIDLLNPATSTLAVGQNETIKFLVRVNPANRPVTLNNQVRALATDPNNPNTPVTDDSANDANNPGNPNPDTNNDGNPNNDTSPTPLQLPPAPTPRIGVGKSAASAVDATPADTTDGLFDVAYAISVQNAGNVDLTNVQLAEDFASQFGLTYTPGAPGVGQYTITAPPATAAPLAANPAFTGSGANTGLLDPAGSTLAVGQTQTLTVGVRVNINPANFPFLLDNQVIATGTGGGQSVSGLSSDGTNGQNPNNPNPDPDGDGDPSNNNIPTRLALPLGQLIPRIGTAKVANTTGIVDLGDGRFNIPYTIVVENAGTDNLTGVQVTENFEAANPLGFGLTYTSGTPARGQFTLIGTPNTSNPLRINPAFTGSPTGSINLLDAANSTLPIGQRREINFVVQVFPSAIPVTLNNQAQAAGTGAQSGRPVVDDSVDGLNTSPDGDLNPNNNTGPTSTLLPPRGIASSGDFVLVKRITNATRNGQTIAGFDFRQFVDDPSNTNDNALNNTALKPVGLLNVPGLQSGDEVEYTVYYLAGGRQPVVNARLCDLVPERTTFIPNSFGGDSGILLRQGTVETAQTNAADGDKAQFFSPLAPVNSVIPPCPTATTNPNGAVFSSLGDIPNTGQNQTGFLRFRVRLD